MINLIPPAAKTAVKREYFIRVGAVWLLIWSVAIVIGGVTLLPTYVLINSQVQVYSATAAAASEKVASYKDIADELVQTSNQARLIVETARLEPLSGYFAAITSAADAGITVLSTRLSRADGGLSPLTVTGVAQDRQSLAAFRDRLLADEHIATVDLPIANLAQDKNITFTLTIVLSTV